MARSGVNCQSVHALDIRFHDAVMRASGNEPGRTIVLAIIETAHRYARYGAARLGHVNRSQPGHVAMFEALVARDPEWARRAVRDHISGAAMLSDEVGDSGRGPVGEAPAWVVTDRRWMATGPPGDNSEHGDRW